MIIWLSTLLLLSQHANGFWDIGTTTASTIREDVTPRQSFFRWQISHFERLAWWFRSWDWYTIRMNRRLNVICGLSIDFLPLGTGTILNHRSIISSANFLEPYLDRQKDVRVWTLGREGLHYTPYRFRVWRIRRILPKSLNPEHWHGPRGIHVTRHDIAVIHTMDQMYLYQRKSSTRWHYANRALLAEKHMILGYEIWFAGSGFEYLEHISENYKIFFANQTRDEIVDCSKYLPKWWGKFICIINTHSYAGVPNGGGLFVKQFEDILVGLGCFEIRYNEDRIMAFTDLRYYMDLINMYVNISYGEYYEYAYPQWMVKEKWHKLYDSMSNSPYIPRWQKKRLRQPYGK